MMRTEPTDELAGHERTSSSTAAITGWLAIIPVSVRASVGRCETVTVTLQRLPAEPTIEPRASPSGYREHAGDVNVPPVRSLEELAVGLGRHGCRFRRRGRRLVPRWFERIRVIVTAMEPASSDAELHITGDVGEVARVCAVIAAELGPCVLGIDESSLRVDATTTAAAIRRELRSQVDGRSGPVPCGRLPAASPNR
jgi:hypothetical protein